VAGSCEHNNDLWCCIHYWKYFYVSEDLTVLVNLGIFHGVFDTSLFWNNCSSIGILVAVRSKAYVCSRWIAGIAGLNPVEDMDVRLLCLLCR